MAAAMNYSAQKVPQLQQLCKDRGLQTTGKKAELIERLEQYDILDNTATAEDEIDWDEEPAADKAATANNNAQSKADAATTASVAAATADAREMKVSEDDVAQAANNAPVNTDENTAPTAPAAPNAEDVKKMKEQEQTKFSTGLASRTLDEEIEKRKARARKFGMPENSDEIKALERTKKFGGTDLPGLLNSALPEKVDRKRGSGADHEGGTRKKGREGRGPRGNGGDAQKTKAVAKEGGYPGWMTKEDRVAAEKRKAKFAAAT